MATRSAWSPEDRDEFDALLDQVIASTTNTSARLDLMEILMDDALQAHRFWARDVDRAARRHGFANEIKRRQDVNRVMVCAQTGKVLSARRIQGTVARTDEGEVFYQRELIELWPWEQILNKRAEAIRGRRAYDDAVAHYDKLLALRDLCPESTSPDDAARRLGINLDGWLARKEDDAA